MNRRNPFGSHLYTQIVAPLLVASVIVGLVATAVAVYFLRDLTDKWVEQHAESATSNLAYRHEEYARQMQRVTAFIARGDELRKAAETDDDAAVKEVLARQNAVLGFDCIVLIGPDGLVRGCEGALSRDAEQLRLAGAPPALGPRMMFDTIGDQPVLASVHPVFTAEGTHTLVTSYAVDDMYLSGLGVGGSTAYALYTSDMDLTARNIGDAFNAEEREALLAVIQDPTSPVSRSLEGLADGGERHTTFNAAGTAYHLWALPVSLPGASGEDGASAYLVGIVSQSVSQRAGSTTTNLIMLWSVAAIVALVALGGWVARRVSDPLVALSAGARRIADGDFSTKVEVAGANEVAELAETFNMMTDSLRERSDSLTKKVLELATLYEMSRALGSTLEMDELLGSVLRSALRIFDLDMGYVALRDQETGILAIRAMRGVDDIDSQAAVRSSMSEWVSREGRPLIFNPDPRSGEGRIDTVTGASAALCVPLVSTEGTIGSITVGSSDPCYRFNSDDVRLLSTIANHVTIAIGNIELFTSLQEAYLATVRSLAAAVDAKDTYTRGHSDRVAMYATLIAERLGLPHEQRIALEMAAYLHDIGKIGVREEILLKPGRLDDVEMAQMRHHPLIGANILQPVAFPWAITPIVRHHHEYYDGSGYPAGLRGDEIPLLARILTIADSFEAMTADRPYRKGMSPPLAVEELRACAGTQFDPDLVEVFIELILEMEESGEAIVAYEGDEISPEEARAVFSALVDGLLMSFRKLGGPRLAGNVEEELDGYFMSSGMPFRLVRGRVKFVTDAPAVTDGEIQEMRAALRRIDAVMSRLSGTTLVEHFYTDTAEGFSSRMKELTGELAFIEAS